MQHKNTFKLLTLFTALSFGGETLNAGEHKPSHSAPKISPAFCTQAKAHGSRSWQTLSAYDSREHRGVNLYLMDTNERKHALSKMVVGLPEEMKEKIIAKQLQELSAFDNMNESEKTIYLLKELNGHGIHAATIRHAVEKCEP